MENIVHSKVHFQTLIILWAPLRLRTVKLKIVYHETLLRSWLF